MDGNHDVPGTDIDPVEVKLCNFQAWLIVMRNLMMSTSAL